MKVVLAFIAAVTTAGCLDPLVGDEPGPPADTILPAGTVLPSIDDDPDRAEELEEYDGVDGLIPRVNAFAAGMPVRTWDFGTAPAFAAPIYSLVERNGTGFTFLPHNPLVDVLPGDPGYSPYWAVFRVVVTDRYAGEVIPSVAALDEAEARGLIERPFAVDFAIDCPIVASDVRLEVGGGQPPMAPTRHFNVRGFTVTYFDFGGMALADGVRVPDVRRYLLRREGGEPLSEPVRGVDVTGDGDANDTNDVYDRTPGEMRPSPLCRTVTVAVPAATRSIDTTADETMADVRDADQLFDPGPVAGTVVAYAVTDELRHCVFQKMDGGL